MIHNLTTAMTNHADLLRKQRDNFADMAAAVLTGFDAAIADAEGIIGGPVDDPVERLDAMLSTLGEQKAETGEPAVQYREAAE